MADHQPTPQQQRAIDVRDRDLLVSAAAGSGKTATLTRRVIASLLDGTADLSRLLIVTFTRAAAREMRTRIAAALTAAMAADPGNMRLAKQLTLLGGARISTIDAFYLDVVRDHFEAAGLSPNVRPVDEKELFALRRDTMNAVIDEMFGANEQFAAVADLLGETRRQNALTTTLLTVYNQLRGQPDGLCILDRSIETSKKLQSAPYETEVGKLFLGIARDYAAKATEISRRGLLQLTRETDRCQSRYQPVFEGAAAIAKNLTAALTDKIPDAVCAALYEPMPAKPGGNFKEKTDDLSAILNEYAVFAKAWRNFADTFAYFDDQEIKKSAAATVKLLISLKKALEIFDERYRAAKAEREVAEFSDISEAAHRLLVNPDGSPTDTALSLRAEFDAVYIDEFQDTDRRQDDIFRVLSNGHNRFLVGDVKQSIYLFRGADADIFNAYRRDFPPLDKAAPDRGATVFMSDCFRCDRHIVDFTNAVSGYLFRRMVPEMNYTEADDLVFCKQGLPAGHVPKKCRLSLLEPSGMPESAKSVDKPEALLICREIKRLLSDVKKADGSRVTPRDIAVFARNENPLTAVAEALSTAGIPVNDTTKKNPFENPEVLCVISLLSVIDNPQKDIHLAAVLRSPLFGFTLSDLVTIRSCADHSHSLFEAMQVAANKTDADALSTRCRRVLESLAAWRGKARQLPVDKLLRCLYRDTLLYGFTGGDLMQKDYDRRANLQRLYEYARRFESGGFRGLYQFIHYIEGVMESGQTIKEDHAAADAVTLSTIHGAKGLEYPFCLLIDSNNYKTLENKDARNSWLIDKQTGFTCRVLNDGMFSQAETFAHAVACYVHNRSNLAEETRLLYVAMTRAKEQLIVTGTMTKALRERLAENRGLDPLTDSAPTYLKWIALALSGLDGNPYCEVTFTNPAELTKETAVRATSDDAAPDACSEATAALLKERFDFVYPHAHLTRLPAKLSVSRLSPTVLDVYDGDGATTQESDVDRLLHAFDRSPLFGEKKAPDAAERGTATHEFLQFCDFARAEKEGVAAELAHLTEAGFLPETAADEVRQDELDQFFKSRFFADLRAAGEIHRETRFNIFLPAREFTENADFKEAVGDEKLLVQGVIDLFFTDADGKLVLCDYKTDRLTAEQRRDPKKAAAFLFDRHGGQLRYYKEALLSLCGRYPDRVLIYSLPLGEAVAETTGG